MVGSVALLVARRTNDREVVGSRPTKVVCITVLTGNRMGVNCPLILYSMVSWRDVFLMFTDFMCFYVVFICFYTVQCGIFNRF